MIYGVLIRWTNPENKNYNQATAGVDYNVVKTGLFPRQDGEQITGLDPSYEWLVNRTPFAMPDYDSRIWILTETKRISNEINNEYPNYNSYETLYGLQKRTSEDIIASIRAKEAEANAAIMSEAESSKLIVLSQSAAFKNQQGIALSEGESAAQIRMVEVADKINRNAANAELLISIAENNNEPDIDSGWEYDNLSDVGYPFS